MKAVDSERLAGVSMTGVEGAQWLEPLRDWPGIALRLLQREPAAVRIVMAHVKGSAPREAGVCMLVGREAVHGTIGGGQLEWQALRTARGLLNDEAPRVLCQRIVLGGDIGQCCGGVVDLWIERYTAADLALLRAAREAAALGPAAMISSLSDDVVERRVVRGIGVGTESDLLLRTARERAAPRLKRATGSSAEFLERLDDASMPLWVYGAGHVGQALTRILLQLPLKVTWVDSRAELFPARIADSVHMLHSLAPVTTVADAPPGTRFVVMTHSHSLDYSLCRAILTRGDFSWVGLIGSHSKAARFRSRLARHGVEVERIARLVCPIGVRGIDSKWPAAIAVGVAAQLLQSISVETADEPPIEAPARSVSACSAGDCETCHAPDAAPK
jgi:xanthine dehydrogenase accessory factor